MVFKVLLGIPFLEKIELVFILYALAKAATLASLLRPDGVDQESNRLGQFQALLRKDLLIVGYEPSQGVYYIPENSTDCPFRNDG